MVLDWEMHSPSVSVIVPVRDGRRQLKSCLETLTRQGVAVNCEIIVVDDGSQDGSAEVAIQQQGVRVIRQGRVGAAAARNRGVRESCGEVVVFTDADCTPEEHWMEWLTRPIFRDGVSGTVGQCLSDQQHWVARLAQEELAGRYERVKKNEV